jgi:hypothetical protein
MEMTLARRFAVAILAASVVGVAYGRGNLKELTVTLKFIPQEGVHATSADLPLAMLSQPVDIRVEDARKLDDPLLIGHGTGGTPSFVRPTRGDRSLGISM